VLAVSRSKGIDVTAPDAADRILDTLGGTPPEILVNNAGTSYAKALDELTEDDWQLQWDLNVMASMRLMRAFVPHMAERGWGRVVNMSSSAGKRPSLTNAAYSVGKAAQAALSRVFADTYAAQNVLVNAVAPGAVASELWMAEGGLADQTAKARGISREEAIKVQEDKVPLGRHRGGDRQRRRLPVLRARLDRHGRELVRRRRHGCNRRLNPGQSPSCHPPPASATCTPARWSRAWCRTSAARSCRRAPRRC
jgi:NAD(P)-dependent dehydrogenase (short-subunit alcohol dehydrogenase family)